MATEQKRDGVDARLLTAAGAVFKPGDMVTITYAGGVFAVNGGGVHTIEESETVVTLFATAPSDLPQSRDVITYHISPDDWRRCLELRGDNTDSKDRPQRFRVDDL